MFCFRLSFFPRGGGPGGLRAGQPGRAGGFEPGGWLRAWRMASGRATGPGGWLRAERANHLFNWRLGPVSPPVVQPVLQPKQSPVLQPLLRPTQSPVFQPVVQSSLQPTQSLVLQPVVQPSLQPTQSSVLQPLFQQHFNRRSRQSCQCTSTEVADNATRFRKNSIGNPQNLCEVTHFYT